MQLEAVVTGFGRKDGKRFAIAKPAEEIVTEPEIKGTVIFFLGKKVWSSEIKVKTGMKVILEDLFETVGGWQASKARPKQLQSVKSINAEQAVQAETEKKG